MWSDPILSALLSRPEVRAASVNHCAFGSPHRKATKFVFGGTDLDLGPLGRPGAVLCTGRHGFCSFSGKKHIVLEGRSAREAAAYPPKLAKLLARALLSPVWIERHSF